MDLSTLHLDKDEDTGDESYFSHRFFEALEDLDGRDFDNYVVDVNVIYSIGRDRKYFSDIFADSDTARESWERLDQDRFVSKNKNRERRVLKFRSNPDSRLNAIDQVSEEAEIYIPDIAGECLAASDRPMKNRDKIMRAFEQGSSYLEVKSGMDVEDYSHEGLEQADTIDEDRALVEAANELDGETCILTYDGDFISEDVYATVPEVAADLEN